MVAALAAPSGGGGPSFDVTLLDDSVVVTQAGAVLDAQRGRARVDRGRPGEPPAAARERDRRTGHDTGAVRQADAASARLTRVSRARRQAAHEPQRQLRHGPEHRARVQRQQLVAAALEALRAREQRAERDARFEPRQVRADAVVRAEAEGEVRVLLARDVEDSPGARRPARRGSPSPARRARSRSRGSRRRASASGARRAARIELHRRREAQHLFDRRGQQAGIVAQALQLAGVGEQLERRRCRSAWWWSRCPRRAAARASTASPRNRASSPRARPAPGP